MPPVKKPKQKISAMPVEEVEATPVVSAQLDKKIKKQKQKVVDKRGVIFIKHLPHGFFEDQLKKYFQQFGTVTRLRLARSKRTGGSKGFAFVEFEYPEVAQVAAETMDNYLMFKKVVKASYIPPEHQKFNYFKTTLRKVKNKAGKEIYISGKSAAIQRKVKEHNDWSENAYQKRTKANLQKIDKLRKRYEHLGIDFASIIMAPKKIQVDEKAEDVNITTAVEQQEAETSKAKTLKRKNVSVLGPLKTQKQAKKEIVLKDLLGNTLPEDSEDEDWLQMSEQDDEEATSDEESYGFLKESDDEELEEEDEGKDSEEEEQMIPLKSNKKLKSSFEKPTKPSKVDRLDQIIKRKPHLGGIKKVNKKAVSQVNVSKAKKVMQVAAVKELTKAKTATTRKPTQKAKLAKKQKV